MPAPGQPRLLVWDRFVRTFHWALVLGFSAAYLTRHVSGPWHEWLGYLVLALVALRLVWGFTGSKFARFGQFVRAPGHTIAYAATVASWRQARYIGHNPLGGWMVVMQMVTIAVICVSGWLYTTDRFWGIDWVENLHDASTWLALALVTMHVCGVILASLHDRENLVASMIHGRKRYPQAGDVN